MSGTAERTSPTIVVERVLQLVRDRAASADAEIVVRTGTSALTRFANGIIHQNVAETLSHVALRVALDGRVAATGLDAVPDEEALERLVEHAFDAARVSPVDPDWPGVAGSEEVPQVDHWDEATADAPPELRARGVAAFVAAADGLATAGAFSTAATHTAVVTTGGQSVLGRATVATLDGIARTSTSDGVARSSSAAVGDIDAGAAGRRAAAKARASADAGDLEPGRYEVVLEPSCVANILEFLLTYGFGGRAVEEGRSFVRVDERQFDDSLLVRQDVVDPRMVGLGFDAEGSPRRTLDVIREGAARSILHDRRSAAKAGVESTGNAVLGPNPWGHVPAALVVSAGGASPDELVARMERGILVSDFWYTRVLDPRTLVVTGLTRNGVWLVEDGRIVRPIRNLRFTQSYAEALGPETVLEIGNDPSLFPDTTAQALLVPSLRLRSWNFTGGARG